MSQALLAAIEAAEREHFSTARAHAERALEARRDDAYLHLAAAGVFFACRDYQRALELAERAVELEPRLRRRVTQHQLAFAQAVGWSNVAREALSDAIRDDPDDATWQAYAALLHARGQDPETALDHAAQALELETRSPRMRMEVAHLLSQVDRMPEAVDCASKAIELAPDEELSYLLAGGRIMISSEAFDEGAEVLERALKLDPKQPGVHVTLAELALWKGDTARARERAALAHALAPDDADADRILAIATMLDEGPEAACAPLDAVLARAPNDYQALIWRAEAAYRTGDYERAHELLSRATMAADGFVFVAWMLRFLIVSKEGNPDPILPQRTEEFLEQLLEICPGTHEVIAGAVETEVADVIEEAIRRMRGNRSSTPTFVDAHGDLRRVRARSGARNASRRALQLIRILPPVRVIERLDEVVRLYPDSSLPVCHRGELYLWLGDLDSARRDLERAIEILPQTRWAYIGLSGIEMLEGKLEQALATSARGVEVMDGTYGPAVFIYRGEVLRRLGRFDAAREDLEKVAEMTPARLSAWVNLALLYFATGETEQFERAWKHVLRAAPALVSDAGRAEGIVVWGDPEQGPGPAERVRLLERSLDMMGGNRATSCTTYFSAEGALRFVQPHSPSDPGPGAAERESLRRARFVLARRDGLLGPQMSANAQRRKIHEPSTLDTEQIEHFVEHGWVVVRDCFSRETAAQWVEEATSRIRERPERWIEGYDPRDASRDLTRFDPDDSSTWTWPRVNLQGDRWIEIQRFSPRLWGAIADLLGGPRQIGTDRISNYFVVNFQAEFPPDQYIPKPGATAWHIDGPSRATRLDDHRNGLVGLLFFSDVEPGGGGTCISPDSVGHVARLLAQHPDGVDLVDRSRVPELTHECREFLQLTGKVGDVVLLHPFMVHASSANDSGRIRWMINANIGTRRPLDFRPRDESLMSPVERAVAARLPR